MSLALRSRLLLQTSVTSPLGTISLAGHLRDNRGVSLTQMRTFGKYALVYLLEGSGRMRSGKRAIVPCRKGDLLFLYPEIPHGYGPGPNETWSEIYLVFNGPIFDLWRQQGLLDPRQPLRHLSRVAQWRAQLEAVVDSRIPDTTEGMLKRICRLQTFLAEIQGNMVTPDTPALWLDEAIRRLAGPTTVSPAALARELGLSYETFRKSFVLQTGYPPAHYRVGRLIDQARVLITERNLSNKEIAETLGFYDEFHFSKRFRQVTGHSPREFRKKARKAPAMMASLSRRES